LGAGHAAWGGFGGTNKTRGAPRDQPPTRTRGGARGGQGPACHPGRPGGPQAGGLGYGTGRFSKRGGWGAAAKSAPDHGDP